ncbi:MAG: hypothetical protein R2839_01430 [Thermomicrobiales bacterium]
MLPLSRTSHRRAIDDLTGSFDLALTLMPFVAMGTLVLALMVPSPRTFTTHVVSE